jgi:hypothetical protein
VPFIVPGVVRYTINQRKEGRVVANVLDYFLETTGSVEDRPGSVSDMAGVLINEWSDEILTQVTTDLVAESVSWVDLDSASGSTGIRTTTSQETWPQTGIGTNDPYPSNVAVLVKKNTAGGRGRRAGRLYLAGVSEGTNDATSSNNITAATQTALNTRFAAFLGNTNQTVTAALEYTSAMSVVHVLTRDADGRPLTGDHNVVTNLAVDRTLATQRRRLR